MKTILMLAVVLLVVALIVGGCFVAGLVTITTPQTNITKAPMPRHEFVAEFGMTNLPISASNICYASASAGMGFAGARMYRFDAPADDCISYGQYLTGESSRSSDSNHQVNAQLQAISTPPQPISPQMRKAYGFEGVEWFDVETVRTGLEGRGPPTGLSCFWIDTERNRFYYYWTD